MQYAAPTSTMKRHDTPRYTACCPGQDLWQAQQAAHEVCPQPWRGVAALRSSALVTTAGYMYSVAEYHRVEAEGGCKWVL